MSPFPHVVPRFPILLSQPHPQSENKILAEPTHLSHSESSRSPLKPLGAIDPSDDIPHPKPTCDDIPNLNTMSQSLATIATPR
jgi:hypothetical protein